MAARVILVVWCGMMVTGTGRHQYCRALLALLIFLVGTLLGVLAGGTLCVRYLRSEISARIGLRLRRMQRQPGSLETAVNLALMTRYADLSAGPPAPALPVPPTGMR